MFSVVIEVLTLSGFIGWASRGFGAVLSLFGLEPGIVEPLISGLFEITIGCEVASKANIPLFQQVMAVNAIIAWSGAFCPLPSCHNGQRYRLEPASLYWYQDRASGSGSSAYLCLFGSSSNCYRSCPGAVFCFADGKADQASLLLLFVVLLLLLGGILLGFFGRKIVFFSVRKDAKP